MMPSPVLSIPMQMMPVQHMPMQTIYAAQISHRLEPAVVRQEVFVQRGGDYMAAGARFGSEHQVDAAAGRSSHCNSRAWRSRKMCRRELRWAAG